MNYLHPLFETVTAEKIELEKKWKLYFLKETRDL